METASKTRVEDVADMTWTVRKATRLLREDEAARNVFRAVEEGRGRASGWGVVTAVGLPADDVAGAIVKLKECGLIDATDAGLDGYYSLTKLGFAVKNGYSIAV